MKSKLKKIGMLFLFLVGGGTGFFGKSVNNYANAYPIVSGRYQPNVCLDRYKNVYIATCHEMVPNGPCDTRVICLQ
ncbi:MAG: hypothetical protein MUE81_11745 [Thermoflexibacter sp.]|nr:hypothetical protein [Thermoflexibacter sp.]